MSSLDRARLTPPPPTDSPNRANTQRPPGADTEAAAEDHDVESLDEIGSAQAARGNMSSFLFMTIMLFMLTNNGGEDLVVRNQYRDSLRTLRLQQSNFSTWLWSGGNSAVNGNADLNFSLPETDMIGTNLAHAAMGFGVPLNPSYASYFSNITGFMQGHIKVYNLTNISSEASSTSIPVQPTRSVSQPDTPVIPDWASIGFEFIKDINMTDALEHVGVWNWSADTTLTFRVVEKQPTLLSLSKLTLPIHRMNDTSWSDISLMHGRIELEDKQTEDETDFDFEAVHFLENGTIYGLAEPAGRHVDVRNIPSLVPEKYLNETAQAVNAELLNRIDKLQERIDSGSIEVDGSSAEEKSKTSCSFLVFGQLVPTSVTKKSLLELEAEMDEPQGISTVSRPEMKMNAILLSKDCGVLIEMREGEGMKLPHFWRKVTTYSGLASIVYLVLLVLFIRQADVSRTPSGVSRVSRWTFLSQAAADSISFVGHLTFGILADGRPAFSLLVPAFLAAVLLVYEAQFSVLIHQIQQPEENVPAVRRPPTSSSRTDETTPDEQTAASGVSEGNAPAQANTPSIPASPSSFTVLWRSIRENPQARFWISVICALTLFIRVLVSPSLAFLTIGVIYSNVWVPQIVRSIRRGLSSGLRPEYLIGTTLCRVYFAAYMFGCPKNVLGIDQSPWVKALVTFMFAQAAIVMLQNWFGPTFFLPRIYVPSSSYDYHPYIPLPDDEAPEPSLGDCAICMDAILVQPGTLSRRRSISDRPSSGSLSRRRSGSNKDREREKERERGLGGLLERLEAMTGRRSSNVPAMSGTRARRSYALAPCHHLFHTACLDKWLAIKNICPQCRRPLPPL